jgi:pyruvate/2-oxoglutarate dehydrogenase complex dihydrolipoamide acyltransferase (E2) component
MGYCSCEYLGYSYALAHARLQKMKSGSIVEWNMSESHKFKAGDMFCIVEMVNSDMDWEAVEDGVLARILVPAGMEISCGTPVMITVDDVEHVSAFANYTLNAARNGATVVPLA